MTSSLLNRTEHLSLKLSDKIHYRFPAKSFESSKHLDVATNSFQRVPKTRLVADPFEFYSVFIKRFVDSTGVRSTTEIISVVLSQSAELFINCLEVKIVEGFDFFSFLFFCFDARFVSLMNI